MSTLLSRKQVTARKAHRCECCGGPAIKPGQTYVRESYVDDGRVYAWVSCTPCSALLSVVYDWAYAPEDGVGMDTYDEWAREHRDDPEHGEAAQAFLARRAEASR